MKKLEDDQHRDQFSVEAYVAYKMKILRTQHYQNIVEHIISNDLWKASMGKYDEPFGSQNSLFVSFSRSSSQSCNNNINIENEQTMIEGIELLFIKHYEIIN